FTGALPELWLFALGGLFVLVTLFLPKGIVGLWEQLAAAPRRSGATSSEAVDAEPPARIVRAVEKPDAWPADPSAKPQPAEREPCAGDAASPPRTASRSPRPASGRSPPPPSSPPGGRCAPSPPPRAPQRPR